jgi:hypothetical protein
VITELELHSIMGESLVARGLATSEMVATDRVAVEARLAGTPAPAAAGEAPAAPAASATAPAVDAPHVDPMDAEIFSAPPTPSDYKTAPLPDGVQPASEADVAAAKAAFHEAGVPQAIFQELDRQFLAAAAKPPTAAAMEATRQQTMQALHRTHGDNAQKVLATAQKEFRAMVAKNPRLAELAEVSGIGNSLFAITSLYNNARAKGRA